MKYKTLATMLFLAFSTTTLANIENELLKSKRKIFSVTNVKGMPSVTEEDPMISFKYKGNNYEYIIDGDLAELADLILPNSKAKIELSCMDSECQSVSVSRILEMKQKPLYNEMNSGSEKKVNIKLARLQSDKMTFSYNGIEYLAANSVTLNNQITDNCESFDWVSSCNLAKPTEFQSIIKRSGDHLILEKLSYQNAPLSIKNLKRNKIIID